jgi:16S rRNA (uracil1498-N3)-methyltransferase
VEVRLEASRLVKRMAHWQAVIQAACGQCGRATVPVLKAPQDLEDWLQAPAPGLRLVLTPEAELSISTLDPLARMLHQSSTATDQEHALTGFRSVGVLDIVSTMPARSSVAKASRNALLNRLATSTGATRGPAVPVELLVGPEGGLTEREHERCAHFGVLGISMGPRILRTETAGPAAIAVLQALFGDF